MGSAFHSVPSDATLEEREVIYLKRKKALEDLTILARTLAETITEAFGYIRLFRPGEHAYTQLKTYHNHQKNINKHCYQHTNSQARQLYGVPSVWRTCKK